MLLLCNLYIRVRYAGKYMFTSVSASYAFGVDKEIARIGKPCVVALNIFVFTLFLSSFYMSVYTLAHMNLQ